MGGEGSIQAMNTILNNNRELLRKKRMFDKDKGFSSVINLKLEFKKVTNEELDEIKERIRYEAKKERKKFRIILILLFISVSVLFYYLLKDFSIDFSVFMRGR